jgi:tRNA-Thr(GGU) m(6)t(6)A37 methyltransferase TsaA
MSKWHRFVAVVVCLSTVTLIVPRVIAAEAGGYSPRAPGLASQTIPAPTANEAVQPEVNLSLVSLGVVKRDGKRTFLVLEKKYAPGLVSLGDFSHVMVFYWCDKNDTPEKRAFLQGYRRGKANPLTGVFATRSPARPNPIAITTCKIVFVKDNIVEIDWIDAFDDSPILDLKPYIPRNDSFPSAKTPVWVR